MNEINNNNNNTWTMVDDDGTETIVECATAIEDKWGKSFRQPNKDTRETLVPLKNADESWSTQFVVEKEEEKEKKEEKETKKATQFG